MRRIVLVLSDLHLGAGIQKGHFDPFESFAYDDRFADLLAHYTSGEYAGDDVELVLAGDIFDLIRIRVDGKWPTEVTEEIAGRKLRACLDGHPVFIDALRRFAARERSRITYLPGNHDLDFVFPGVQALLRERVAPDHPERLRFVDRADAYDLPGGVQIRHGHQFEAIHRVDYERLFFERGGRKLLNLPWGTLVQIEVLNPMKEERHHLDRVVPLKRFLMLGLLVDFRFTLRFIFRSLAHFVRTRLSQVPRWKTRIRTTLRIVRDEFLLPFSDFDDACVAALKKQDGVHTLVVGHSHGPKCRLLPGGKLYINTGTWTPMVQLELGALGQATALTYALVEYAGDGRPATSLMRWHGPHPLAEVVYY